VRAPNWRTLLDWAGTICLALAFVLIFEAEVAKPYRIPSSSMEPTLHCAKPGRWCEGRFSDRVVVNRLAYRYSSPKRGQVVVFTAPAAAEAACGEGGTYVKRLIGLPGDVISEKHGVVFVNGKRMADHYIPAGYRDDVTDVWPRVPKDHYFFMGDDRRHSCDSRTWGTVPRSSLIGPVLLTYWPPGRMHID
jgi:signal peptidase I